MKKTRKIATLLLAVVMLFSLATTAFAADDVSDSVQTYTITAPANSARTYSVYQIFTGDLSDNVLSNVKWGKNGTGEENQDVDQDVLAALAAVNSKNDTEKLAVIQEYVDWESDAFGTVSNDNPLSAPAGYYLIKDNGPVGDGEAYSLFVVEIVNDVTIAPKTGTTEFEKKVKDINDTTDTTTTDWQDSADWDIGDKIPFQLKGTVTSEYDSYKNYYFAFHDVEDSGLTFDASSVKVYVDGNEITSGYELKTTDLDDGCTFEVVFSDLKNIASVKAGSVITVEYESTLNANAVLGSQGNVNKAQLEYSNNPNNEGHGKTVWDNVIVFTYKVVVNKYANSVADGNRLTGAEFTLEKILSDNTTKIIKVVTSEDGTEFTFKGLDDGNYILTETKTPAGYNTIDPITFTVSADHTITWDGNDRAAVLTSLTGTEITGEITFTPDTTAGSLSANVINNSGSTMPETGGMGTTIFYVIGGVLVLGAVVLLVTRKRMNSAE